MFWLCLRFPQLALEALRVDSAACDERPFAIIDGPLQRRHVVLADAAARAAGVHAGQAVAAAQMLCPRLAVAPRDEAVERQTLESLAGWTYRFSAEINIAAPETILAEVGGSLALFGGWPTLERRMRGELDRFGFVYSLAAAPTAAAACILAAHADGIAIPALANLTAALAQVPLAASGLDAKMIAALHGMGFRHLRDLFRLPRAELARRIGQDALTYLDRMRGLVGETLPRWRPPDRFERRIEFSFGIQSHTALAFPLQRLIRELALFLIARDGGVQRFALVLGHERGASTTVEVGLLTPQREATSLLELARARLERIKLSAPIHALTLRVDDLPPLCPLHRDLFEVNRREQLGWPALAERLRARLGDSAMQGLACAADHRPARAWRFAADETGTSRTAGFDRNVLERERTSNAVEAASATRTPASIDVHHRRPFWLLRRPIVLRETPARILAGPERIESGWWDEHDQRRDYYIIETRRGQRAWVFVEAGTAKAASSSQANCTAANWNLHGWFA